MKTILCYGDSNTYGFCPTAPDLRYPVEKRWTTLLEKMLGSGFCVRSEGMNGRTTDCDWPENNLSDGMSKNGLAELLRVLRHAPPIDILILMLGTNDCCFVLSRTVEDIVHGMERVILTAKEVTRQQQGYVPKLLLVAPPHILPEIAGTLWESQIDATSVQKSLALASAYQVLAQKHGCAFADAGSCEVLEIDCEHLSERGHEQTAQILFDALGGLL